MVPLWAWFALVALTVAMIVIDTVVAGKRAGTMSFREAVGWSIGWFAAGIAFTIPVWFWAGSQRASEYAAGYLLERSLSLDNIFVFALIFAAFAVPTGLRPRALLLGIAGAIVLRVLMIVGGVALIHAFHWMLYVMGAILVVTGIRMAFSHAEETVDLERNRTLRLLRRFMPLTDDYRGNRVFVREGGRRLATPMLAVLAVIATTDLVFAFDSIPAIFAITLDPFVVVAANLFALAGLRSLYFLLEGMMGRFHYLQPALALLLVIIGAKLVLADVVHLPVWVSLLLVVGIVGGGVVGSLLRPAPPAAEQPEDAGRAA